MRLYLRWKVSLQLISDVCHKSRVGEWAKLMWGKETLLVPQSCSLAFLIVGFRVKGPANTKVNLLSCLYIISLGIPMESNALRVGSIPGSAGPEKPTLGPTILYAGIFGIRDLKLSFVGSDWASRGLDGNLGHGMAGMSGWASVSKNCS